jgi:hypothetical protein
MRKTVRAEMVLTCRILSMGELDKGPESQAAHDRDDEAD